jgi:MFS family permease
MNQRSLLLFPIALVVFELAVYFSVDMYLPALATVQAFFVTSEKYAQLTLTALLIGAGTVQLVLGPISDRFGRRRVLLAGCGVFVFTALGCATTSSLALFLVLRAIQGSTICTALVAGYACVHESLATLRAVKTLAWMNGVTVLAPAIGPVLGAAVIAVWPWQAIFLLLSAVAVAAWFLLFFFMPETVDTSRSARLSPGHIFSTYRGILGNRAMMQHTAAFCLVFSVMLSWNVASPFMLIDRASDSTATFVKAQAYLYLLFIAGTRLANRLIEKKDPEPLVRIGFNFCITGAILGLVGTLISARPWVPILFFGGFTLGAGLLFPPLFRRTLELSRAPMGSSMAIFSSGMNLFASTATLTVAVFEINTLTLYFRFALAIAAAAFVLARYCIRLAPMTANEGSPL